MAIFSINIGDTVQPAQRTVHIEYGTVAEAMAATWDTFLERVVANAPTVGVDGQGECAVLFRGPGNPMQEFATPFEAKALIDHGRITALFMGLPH